MPELHKHPVNRHCPPLLFFSVAGYEVFEAATLIPICKRIFDELIAPHRYIRDRHVYAGRTLSSSWRGYDFAPDTVNWRNLEKKADLADFGLQLREEERKFSFERPDIASISAECGLRRLASHVEADLDRDMLYGKRVPREVQAALVNIAKQAFSQLRGVTGYIALDCIGAGGSASPYEQTIGLSAPGAAVNRHTNEQLFLKRTRGYFWGNFLSQTHVDILGGEAMLAQAPVIQVEQVGHGYYLQLSEDINTIDLTQLRKLKSFLEPVLPVAYGKFNMTAEWARNLPDFVL
jgi:hypothetical protein